MHTCMNCTLILKVPVGFFQYLMLQALIKLGDICLLPRILLNEK